MEQRSAPLSVSRLTHLLKEVVEENFVHVLVEGELSNLSVPASGHCYFSLKDDRAQIRAVMFRSAFRLLPFQPRNGMRVVCAGRVSLYSQRGELQLVVESLEPRGVGSLQLAFEQLKEKLAAEGLFEQERKRPLPPFPRTVGVITSATGAAIHDIINVLRRRGAGLRVLLRPVRVQGEGAAVEIAEAISDHNRWGEADILIVGRGGGSLEDLWAFNEEAVARAVHASAIPVIAAVGHETDFSIADLVADLRAPTPSAAAEMVARSRLELESHIDHLLLRLAGQMRGRHRQLEERVAGLKARLRSPHQSLEEYRRRRADLEHRLAGAMRRLLRDGEERIGGLAGHLDALSPLRTLSRGYAIAFSAAGTAVRDAAEVQEGDRLRLRFSRGQATVVVEETEP